MKVVSDTTLVVKTKAGIVEYAPGTVVEYPKEKAEELVLRGLAREHVPEKPRPEGKVDAPPKA